jgi:hypothetical protein
MVALGERSRFKVGDQPPVAHRNTQIRRGDFFPADLQPVFSQTLPAAVETKIARLDAA